MITREQEDDYYLRREGTIFGDIAIDQDKNNRQMWKRSTNKKPVTSKNDPLKIDIEKNNPDFAIPTKKPKTKRIKEPFFPEVDIWIDKHISIKVRRILAICLVSAGTLTGIGFSEQMGLAVWKGGLLGGVAGLLVLPLLIYLIKIFLLFFSVALVGAIFYAIYIAITEFIK